MLYNVVVVRIPLTLVPRGIPRLDVVSNDPISLLLLFHRCCSTSVLKETERGSCNDSHENRGRDAFLGGTACIESSGLHIHREAYRA